MNRTDTVETVFDAVAAPAPEIREGLVDRRNERGNRNPSGERQLAADTWADGLFAERLTAIDGVGAYASEEREAVSGSGDGLSVAVDPLDGSSNLPSNNPVGSIVAIYDGDLPAPGRALVAAAYVLYGPVTTMTAARDGTVTTYAVNDGERRPIETDQRLPDSPTVYGFGGGREEWPAPFAKYASEVRKELKLRYSGALIADVNQVLTYGGVFAYPALNSRPEGKLRHQFEAAPIAYIIESAGGRSSNGTRSLLETGVDSLHGRTPVHGGSPEYIDRLEAAVGEEAIQ
jgi:fructose-1,6-bisphosphatase I